MTKEEFLKKHDSFEFHWDMTRGESDTRTIMEFDLDSLLKSVVEKAYDAGEHDGYLNARYKSGRERPKYHNSEDYWNQQNKP